MFILLNPTLDQVCSSAGVAASTSNSVITETLAASGTPAVINNYCGAVAGTSLAADSFLTETVVQIIANPNVLNLDSIKMKGVYIPPGSGFLSIDAVATPNLSWCTAAVGCGQYNGNAVNGGTAITSNTYEG